MRNVIFDLDGTLVDTMRMTAGAFEACVGRHGLAMPPVGAIYEAMGLHDSRFYRAIFPGAEESRLEALALEVEPMEGEIGRQLGRGILFPGVMEMLERLWAGGLGLHLASTGSPVHVRDMLDCAGIGRFFGEILCGEPDKGAMLGEALRRVPSGGAVYVGDTRWDVEAARANGLKVYGAGFGYVKPRERMLFDAVADTPGALCALLLGE